MKTFAFLFSLILIAFTSTGQWIQQVSNTTSNLKDIHFLNDSVGFVAGSNGEFLKTIDRGQNWQLSVISGAANLTTVFALDPDTIFAGGSSHIYKTTDGGQNWNIINSLLSVNELKFFSSQVGFAKASWEEECPYPNQGSTYRYKYYRTLDGGYTWNYFELFEDHTVGGAEMEIVTADTGYMGAMEIGFWCSYWPCCESASGYLFKTTDGGYTWQELDAWYGDGVLTDVAFLNGMDGFYMREKISPMGYFGPAELYKINDGGSGMSFIHDMPANSIGKFFFANPVEGYYLDSKKIMKTISEGYFWLEDYNGPNLLTDMVMTENYEVYVIGNNGTILHNTLDPVTEPEPLYWLSCDENRLNFPMTNINEEHILDFTLTASGNMDITIDITAPEDFLVKIGEEDEYVHQITGLILHAFHDTTILVKFQPDAYANYSGMIMVASNATNNPVVLIPASGKGVCFLPGLIDNDTTICYDSIWVRNNVNVGTGASLSICPGTVVTVQGGFQIIIDGSMIAEGTHQDSIIFTPENENIEWNGIIVKGDEQSDSVRLEYCRLGISMDEFQPILYTKRGIVSNTDKFVSIIHCLVNNCYSNEPGGGISCSGSNFHISDCLVRNCMGSNGGGIYASGEDNSSVINCIITNCGANDGGGIYYTNAGDSAIINCTISGCSANRGGGIYISGINYSICSNTVSDCDAGEGGGIFAADSGPSLCEGCIIESCTATIGGGLQINALAKLTVNNCEISGCQATSKGGGINNDGAEDNLIKNCNINGNRTTTGNGGGIHSMSASPVIEGNEINYNNAFGGTGGGISCYDGSPVIKNNKLYWNNSDSSGGGIYIENWEPAATSRIIQNLFYRNYTCYGQGGGIFLRKSFADLILNTIAENNSGFFEGDGIYCSQPETTRMIGNIIYNNDSKEITSEDDSKLNVSFCDIRGGWTANGEGNIDQDPKYYGLPFYPWYWINVDYSIMPESPCINAGPIDTTGLGIPFTDLNGNPRIIDGRLDIGAYENNFIYQSIDTGFCEGMDYLIEAIPIEEELYTSIEWTFNGQPVAGEHEKQLIIPGPDADDEGYYQCTFFGADGRILHSRTIYLYNKGFAPEVQEQPVGAILNPGDNFELVFAIYSPDNNTRYQWYLNDSILEGEDERVIFIYDFSKEQQGTYKCWAENTCGGIFSNEAVLTMSNAGIDELADGKLVVYPNPASTQLAVGSWQLAVGIEIYDLFGRTLLQFGNIPSYPLQIDISSLPDGMYVLKMTSKDHSILSSKFIKNSK